MKRLGEPEAIEGELILGAKNSKLYAAETAENAKPPTAFPGWTYTYRANWSSATGWSTPMMTFTASSVGFY